MHHTTDRLVTDEQFQRFSKELLSNGYINEQTILNAHIQLVHMAYYHQIWEMWNNNTIRAIGIDHEQQIRWVENNNLLLEDETHMDNRHAPEYLEEDYIPNQNGNTPQCCGTCTKTDTPSGTIIAAAIISISFGAGIALVLLAMFAQLALWVLGIDQW